MATHLKDLKVGDKTYYISHGGETVYYSTFERGKANGTVKGMKFKNNQILNVSTGKAASDYEIGQKLG